MSENKSVSLKAREVKLCGKHYTDAKRSALLTGASSAI